MALINCPECGKQISDRAEACPNCGCPLALQAPSTQSSTPNNASTAQVVQDNAGTSVSGGVKPSQTEKRAFVKSTPSISLSPAGKQGESTQKVPSWPTIEFKANFREGLNSIGGKIIITATQLIFRAHGFNMGDLRDRVFEIRDIVSYKKGFLTFMDISFSDGETIRLAVGNKQRVIDELETRRESLQVAPQYPPQQPVSSVSEMPKVSLFMAILVTICCFLPFGIVGLIKASKVGRLYARGDYQAAEEYAKSANKWIALAFWIGLAYWCLIALVFNLVL